MYELITIFAGALLSLLLPTLLDGVERKIKARIHSRIGPPLTQSWYDVLKLFSKELAIPPNSLHSIMLTILYFTLQLFTIIYLVIMIVHPLTPYDLIILVALFVILQAIFVSIPFTIPNPFSVIGASREIVLVLVNEAFFIVLLGLYIFYTGFTSFSAAPPSVSLYLIIVFIGLFINSYVSSGRIPFDIAEAEPELASGLMIEFSGPLLGLFLLSIHLKRFFVKFLVSALLFSLFVSEPILLFTISFISTIILWITYSVIAAILGRSRVDLAPITLLKIYLVVTILSLIGYVLGV